MKIIGLFITKLILLPFICSGQNNFPNTLNYDDSIGSPVADISTVSWIEGHWGGEAFNGITEEIWSPPLGGSMMCAFKLVVQGVIKFYELCTISEEEGSLILKIKHFYPDLTGWEGKDESVNFKLVKVEKNKVYFDGFTFEKINDDEMNIYVVIQSKDNKSETKFIYKRYK